MNEQDRNYDDHPGVQLINTLIDALDRNTESNNRLGEILDDASREGHSLILSMKDQKEDNGVLSGYLFMFHDLVETLSDRAHSFRGVKDILREARVFYERYSEKEELEEIEEF